MSLQVILPPPKRLCAFPIIHSVLLLGYAVLGKWFAYIQLGPIYIGECVLALGIVLVLINTNIFKLKHNSTVLLLTILMLWGAVRTLPYLSTYGILSLRDAAMWGYGLFAFITASFVVNHFCALQQYVRYYRKFIPIFLVLAPIVWLLTTGLDYYSLVIDGR
jgi:hypothetical protein